MNMHTVYALIGAGRALAMRASVACLGARVGRGAVCALVVAVTGCALSPEPPDPASAPYQARAAALVAQYNAAHGTDLPTPPVRLGSVPPLEYGETYCPGASRGLRMGCWITVGSMVPVGTPVDYQITHTLPHEVAHYICVYMKLCHAGNDHGAAWRAIARELGLPADDPYLVRPEGD